MDDNFHHARIEWLQRLERHEVGREEAQGVLSVMKARLEFLHNLHSRIGDQTEFAKAAKDVEQEIEQQAGEIEAVEKYVDQASDPK